MIRRLDAETTRFTREFAEMWLHGNGDARRVFGRAIVFFISDFDRPNGRSTGNKPTELSGQQAARQTKLALNFAELAATRIGIGRISGEHIGATNPRSERGGEHDPDEPVTV